MDCDTPRTRATAPSASRKPGRRICTGVRAGLLSSQPVSEVYDCGAVDSSLALFIPGQSSRVGRDCGTHSHEGVRHAHVLGDVRLAASPVITVVPPCMPGGSRAANCDRRTEQIQYHVRYR